MKVIVSILLVLALWAGLSVDANAGKPNAKVYTLASAKWEDPEAIEISASDNRIKVTNAPVGSKLEIYSVVGIKVKEIEMKQPSGEYIVNIAKGYYIIRIGDTVRKIAIR